MFPIAIARSPPARPRRGLADSGAISAAAVAARRRHASASSERPVSVERLLSSSKASWAIASSAQQEQSAFTVSDGNGDASKRLYASIAAVLLHCVAKKRATSTLFWYSLLTSLATRDVSCRFFELARAWAITLAQDRSLRTQQSSCTHCYKCVSDNVVLFVSSRHSYRVRVMLVLGVSIALTTISNTCRNLQYPHESLTSARCSRVYASMISQDDDELERRLNGPDAIAAATATAAASSSRRRSRAGTTGAARAAPRTCSNPNTVSSHGTARSMLVEPTPDMEVEDDSLGDCVNTRTAGRSGANGRSMAAITNTADDVFDLDDSSLGAPNGSRFDSLGMASVGRHKGATEVDAAGGGRQMRDLDTVLDDFQTSVPEKVC